jgi:hypothetical protein
MTKLMNLVNGLCAAISVESEDEKKGELLTSFTEKLSEQILLRAGLTKDSEDWEANLLALALDPPDYYAPDDYLPIQALTCYNVPTALNARSRDVGTKPMAQEFIFCRKRVVMGDGTKIRQVLTYEETARFLVFWFAEKIMQIIRKNQWDRMQHMPELFDRLAEFWTPPQQAFVLVQVIPDADDPDKYGDVENYIGTIFASSIHEAANQTGLKVLDGSTDAVVNLKGYQFQYRMKIAGLDPAIDFTHM